MNGAIFFFAPLLACLCSDSITLTALAASSFRVGGADWMIFFFRPAPSRQLFFACGPQSIPRPPGRGMRGRDGGLRLRARRRFACFSLCRAALSLGARSLSSCLRFWFSFPGSPCFPCLPSGLVCLRRGPSSLRPCVPLSRAFPTACLLSALSHQSGSVGSSFLARLSSS